MSNRLVGLMLSQAAQLSKFSETGPSAWVAELTHLDLRKSPTHYDDGTGVLRRWEAGSRSSPSPAS